MRPIPPPDPAARLHALGVEYRETFEGLREKNRALMRRSRELLVRVLIERFRRHGDDPRLW